MDHLLGNSTGRFDDETPKLIHSFYVDNCVTGVNDIKEQENFIVKAIEVMIRGCFNLRDWESSVPGRYIFRSSGAISLLGLLRDLDKDTLKCNRNYSQDCKLSKYIMWLWRLHPGSLNSLVTGPLTTWLTKPQRQSEKKGKLCNLVVVEEEIPRNATMFSNFQSVIRFVSWMLQFVENVKRKREFRELGYLCPST
ncbi:integrase catalytic domain-containing protein [Trichonephila inaurata madagascariensis]|uniref:Integrase catalytic domain-containing protein n=1 Tax=Trichonephila inaurata madagascariensis TaxID=2747483 RepID=A0A8X6XSP1_9ARAC|nr:integrase catalytic domain-containing protein [Trichonephila inaurata madagascariensis]